MKKLALTILSISLVAIMPGALLNKAGLPERNYLRQAYAEGREIYFVHTEASDADVADKLTAMMKSLCCMSLPGECPDESLANVYVFANAWRAPVHLVFRPMSLTILQEVMVIRHFVV